MTPSKGTPHFRIDPDRIDEASLPLIEAMVISEVGKGNIGNGWNQAGALRLARRAMEVAIRSAMIAGEDRALSDYADDWAGLAKRAQAAAAAMADLVNFMSVRQPNLIGALSPRHLTSISRQLVRKEQLDIHPDLQVSLADELALQLIGGQAATRRVATISGTQQKRIKGSIKNIGEAEKTAFANIWAEAWLALFWHRPSSSRSDTNSFASFLTDAWDDATGMNGQSFSASVGRATKDLPRALTSRWLPSWA